MFKTYPKHGPDEEENGFSAEDIRRGTHWLYTDVTCKNCGKVQPVAITHYIGGPCCRCGELTA